MAYFWKLEAAEILLDDSIIQYFNDKIDPTTFLLAGNARRILNDLLKKEWKESPWLKFAKENNADIKRMLNELKLHSNFFKHADKNKDEIKQIICEEWYLDFIIPEAIWIYLELTSKYTSLMKLYNSYFMYRNREFLQEWEWNSELVKEIIENITINWKEATKQNFYNIYLENKKLWKQ